MISDPFFLISFLISPLIAFASTALIIESLLALFKIKQGRISSLLRLLPSLSVLIDSLFSTLSLGYWLNPLNCSSCLQKLLLTLFFPELKEYLYTNKISLVSYLSSGISHNAFAFTFVIFAALLLILTLRQLIGEFILSKAVRAMIKNATPCRRPIENFLLSAALKKNKAKIFESNSLETPMATYSKAIFIPKNIIDFFPQEEFEAIIAHELEHIRWKDPLLRFFIQLLSTIFWWVPMTSWQQKLELDHEIACDQSILKYGIEEASLASAMLKIVSACKDKIHPAFCYLSDEKHPLLRRLHIMLGSSSLSKCHLRTSFIVFATALIIVIICGFII